MELILDKKIVAILFFLRQNFDFSVDSSNTNWPSNN